MSSPEFEQVANSICYYINHYTTSESNQLIGLMGRVFANGGPGFNPKSCHTKDFKNGTRYLLA